MTGGAGAATEKRTSLPENTTLELLQATLAIYRRAFHEGAQAALANWPVAASILFYFAVFWFAIRIAARLGIAGGFLMSLVVSACLGSCLALVEVMVNGERVTLQDFRSSFGRYLWEVAGVSFLLWIFSQVVTPALLTVPNGVAFVLSAQLILFVLLNAVPELIYLGHHSSIELMVESYRFIGENWIEWFPPNIVLAIAWWWLFSIPIPGGFLVEVPLFGTFLYFFLVVRGFLFRELSGSTRRSRVFRWRMGK